MRPAPAPNPSDTFPTAPSQVEWDALDDDARAQVVASLPAAMTEAELSPPEGDLHRLAKNEASEALDLFFKGRKRSLYVGCDVTVYYPGVRRFAPDVFVVFDVDDHLRDKWVVSAEGRGLDFALEIHVGGDRKKDYRDHPALYASLGIPEYFMFDRKDHRLYGWRLAAPGARSYTPIVPQYGRWASEVLGLDLALEGGELHFYAGNAPLLHGRELRARLQAVVTEKDELLSVEAEARVAAEAARVAAEAERDEQARARVSAEAALALALAELAALRGKLHS